MALESTSYPFDPTGLLASNLIDGELHQVGAATGSNMSFIVPRFAPFFFNANLVIRRGTAANSPLMVEGVDYILTHRFIEASQKTGKQIYGGVAFLDRNFSGTVRLKYQTLGGNWTVPDDSAVEELTRSLYSLRTVSWDQVQGLPASFPTIVHDHDADDLTGMSAVVAKIGDLVAAVEAQQPVIIGPEDTNTDKLNRVNGNVYGDGVTDANPDIITNLFSRIQIASTELNGLPQGLWFLETLADTTLNGPVTASTRRTQYAHRVGNFGARDRLYARQFSGSTWSLWQRMDSGAKILLDRDLNTLLDEGVWRQNNMSAYPAATLNYPEAVAGTLRVTRTQEGVGGIRQTYHSGMSFSIYERRLTSASPITWSAWIQIQSSTGTISADRLPTVPVEKGGTNATTAQQALINLGAMALGRNGWAGNALTAVVPDLDSIQEGGWHLVEPRNVFGAIISGTILHIPGTDINNAMQQWNMVIAGDTAASARSRVYIRQKIAGQWSDWLRQTSTREFTGMVAPFAMKDAPEWWVKCNGAALNRVVYVELFNRLTYTLVIDFSSMSTTPGFQLPAHGLVAGDKISFEASTGQSIPVGVSTGVNYYVSPHQLTSNRFFVGTQAPRGTTLAKFKGNGSNTIVTWVGHGLVAGQPVQFYGAGMPAGIVAGQVYYVSSQSLTADDFQLSSSMSSHVAVSIGAASSPVAMATVAHSPVINTSSSSMKVTVRVNPWGCGDGFNTFNVPDLRAEFIRGWDDGRGIDIARAFGSFQEDSIGTHVHVFQNNNQIQHGGGGSYGIDAGMSTYNQDTSATGGSETRSRNVAMQYMIHI